MDGRESTCAVVETDPSLTGEESPNKAFMAPGSKKGLLRMSLHRTYNKSSVRVQQFSPPIQLTGIKSRTVEPGVINSFRLLAE